MNVTITQATNAEILPLRVRRRSEANCQIVHDSLHDRRGWTVSYRFNVGEAIAGFGSVAIGGPWKDRPTVFEFYVLPEHRGCAFALFEAFLGASGARFLEVQTSDGLLGVMLHAYGQEIASEKIVFRDEQTTALSSGGAVLHRVTSEKESRNAFEARQGSSDWRLEFNGEVVANGGVLFHYNHPYGDIAMEVDERFRRRGFGAFLVQELKRVAYEMGAIPGARCDPTNVASRRTLQKAGLVPYAHILTATVATARAGL